LEGSDVTPLLAGALEVDGFLAEQLSRTHGLTSMALPPIADGSATFWHVH
jgi:hypothetical protein